ncbi:MAG: pseudouridine synthase [Clostridiales bacterium]
MRLDKFLAQSSVGNRKAVRIYIKKGMIKVNGKIITKPAKEINESFDVIEYNSKIVDYIEKVYYMFNKPAGFITAKKDVLNKTIFDFFSNTNINGIFHVGRLDKDTEGLLLITNDGEFEHKLMYSQNHVEKTYYFWAMGTLNTEDITKLEQGLFIDKFKEVTKPAKIKLYKSGMYQEFKNEIPNENLRNKDTNNYNPPVISGHITITEGRRHQVKRMLKMVGCSVVYLKRISIGNLMLDESLEKGHYRFLTKIEMDMVFGKIT